MQRLSNFQWVNSVFSNPIWSFKIRGLVFHDPLSCGGCAEYPHISVDLVNIKTIGFETSTHMPHSVILSDKLCTIRMIACIYCPFDLGSACLSVCLHLPFLSLF